MDISVYNENYIINNEIVLDLPKACTKINDFDYGKIKFILITSLKGNHFADFPAIFEKCTEFDNNKKIVLVAPKYAIQTIEELFAIYDMNYSLDFILSKFEIIEVQDGDEIKLDGYVVKAISSDSNQNLCYLIKESENSSAVGFCANSSIFDNLFNLIQESNVVFGNLSFSENEITVEDVSYLEQKYPNKKFHFKKVNGGMDRNCIKIHV